MDASAQKLQSRFGIEGLARFDEGAGGMTRLVIDTVECKAELYLQGAHVTRFQPRGHKPILFLSERSSFEPGTPIRGGVPICFPWFAQHAQLKSAPSHGFVRNRLWQVEAVTQSRQGIGVTLSTRSDDESRRFWPTEFAARFIVQFGEALDMTLEVDNPAPTPFRFEAALHTYFAVEDVREVSISGLELAEYFDKVRVGARVRQSALPLKLANETDRVYFNSRSAITLRDPKAGRQIVIEKAGSNSTIVWNPWIEKTRKMTDIAADDWQRMVCIETANVGPNAVTLAGNTSHALRAHVRVEAL